MKLKNAAVVAAALALAVGMTACGSSFLFRFLYRCFFHRLFRGFLCCCFFRGCKL